MAPSPPLSPPWLSDPPFGRVSRGELCLSPHPAAVARPLAGTHKLWCSRLRIHYCFQTAAKGWAGGVPQSPGHLKTLRAPHCMGTPVWSPPAVALGLGGSGPRSMPSWPSRAPGPEDGAVGTQNHRGPPQTAWGGHGELGEGGSLSPFSCGRGAAIWGPRGVTGLGRLRPCPVAPPGRCPHPPPRCLCVSPPAGELSPCEVCVSREWVVAAPVNKTAS